MSDTHYDIFLRKKINKIHKFGFVCKLMFALCLHPSEMKFLHYKIVSPQHSYREEK